MASLKDIAAATGVSIRTVARALQDSDYVGTQTRQRVLETAKTLGYRPNRIAKSLKTQKSYEVSIWMFSTDELHVDKLAGFEQTMRHAGYSTTVLFGHPEKGTDFADEIIEVMRQRINAAVAFIGAPNGMAQVIQYCLDEALPYAVLDGRDPALDGVRLDRQQGVYEAVLYLAAKGRQRIAYLGSTKDDSRLQGYLRALTQLGRSPIILEAQGEDAFEYGRNAAQAFFSGEARPDAVQVYSDAMAMGLLSGLHDLKLRIPDQVAVIGFDDRRAARLAHPPLSTVAQPNFELGQVAAEILLQKITGTPSPMQGWQRTLNTKLILRSST